MCFRIAASPMNILVHRRVGPYYGDTAIDVMLPQKRAIESVITTALSLTGLIKNDIIPVSYLSY